MTSAAPPEAETEPGRLLTAHREVVVAEALPLLASYFADAPSWALATQAQVAQVDAATDELAAFVRMRVALAAITRLQPILVGIVQRPSFFYARETDESVGSLRGPLDLQRFIRTRFRPESPRRYPVRVIHRRYATPENVAACYAASWLARELADAPLHVLPKGAPEYRAVLDNRSLLAIWLRQPVLAQSRPEAVRTRRQRALAHLLDAVRRRLESGRVAGPDRYERLVSWLEATVLTDAGAHAGSVEWAFYDDRFDPKLFEIWSLARTISALESAIGPPSRAASSLLERARSPVRSWRFGAVGLDLFFQPSLERLAGQPSRWRFVEPTKEPLRGFPDIGLVVRPVVGEPFAILVDPKLRRRRSPPSEELYKLLGYFGNLPRQPVLGAVVFYAPGEPRTYRLRGDEGEELLALGVDPGNAAVSTASFATLAEHVRQAAGVSPRVVALLVDAAGREDPEELTTAVKQEAATSAMLAVSQSLPDSSLAPYRKSTSANLSAIWDLLSHSTQTMLVTAEYFGVTAPDDADHSGPLLGLAAACERVLFERVFNDVARTRPQFFPSGATLGRLIHWLHDATRPRPREPAGKYLAQHLTHSTAPNEKELVGVVREPAGEYLPYGAGPDEGSLRALARDLRHMNVTYRIPAAHRDVVSQMHWSEGRSMILDPTAGLLTRLVRATATPPGP